MALTALYEVPAPAKLNLFLHVVGRRPDGYHLLQSVFVLLDWCDTLHLELRHDGRLQRRDLRAPQRNIRTRNVQHGRERDGQKETNGDVLGHDWLTPYDIRTHRPTPLLLDRFHDPSVVTLARIII